MKRLIPTLALVALAGCASGPRLYSPVIPMADGSLFTSPTANSKEKALTRATRNAERYCEHYNQRYAVIKINDIYEGVLAADDADGAAQAVSMTLATLEGKAHRVELAFKCIPTT